MTNAETGGLPYAANSGAIGNPVALAAAGIAILVISLAAALLPLIDVTFTATLIGGMMILAGGIETLAAFARRRNWFASLIPGLATVVAGGLFASGRFDSFLASVQLVIAWLGLRALVLCLTGLELRRSVRIWTLVSGGADLALAGILFTGLAASVFPIALFGLSPEIVRYFAVVLCVSFVTTAMLLIEVAVTDSETCDIGRGRSC